MKKTDGFLGLTDEKTTQTFNYFLNYSINAFLGQFMFENLPNYLMTKNVSMNLLNNGAVAWVEEPFTGKIVCLPYIPTEFDSLTGEPAKIRCNLLNGSVKRQRSFYTEDFIIMYENQLGTPRIKDFYDYSYKLTEVMRTFDTNLATQRTPIIIESENMKRLSFEQVSSKYFRFDTVIKVEKGTLSDNPIKVLKLDKEYKGDVMLETLEKLNNFLLGTLGIISDKAKKERLINSELEASNSTAFSIYENLYNSRIESLEKINERFGLNIALRRGQLYERLYNNN